MDGDDNVLSSKAIHHEWRRYWHERGQYLPYKNGYFNPDDTGPVNGAMFFPFELISANRCLILLGEAGLGKSTVMKQIFKELQGKLEAGGDEVLFCDLGLVTSESSLDAKIFEHPKFTKWINGQHQLYLFLDSFDEGMLQVVKLARYFMERINHCDCSRLWPRIACRTGLLPRTFENDLLALWEGNGAAVFQLAPLGLKDVAMACESCGISSQEFVLSTIELRIQPFASNPITLHVLLDMYKRKQKLPSSKIGLYDQGCRELCRENEDRSPGNVPIDKRLRIATLIAAITVLCNLKGITAAIGECTISIDRLVQLAFDRFGYASSDIKEVLGTALFTERQQGEYAWVHLSYADFLAAKFIHMNEFSTGQILALLLESEDNSQRIVPQLHQVAAWLANLRPEVFTAIITKDPDVLCLSDIAQLTPEKRALLVQSLLDKYDMCPEYYKYGSLCFRSINYEGLSRQLREFLSDRKRSIYSKKIAVQMADFCQLHDVAEDLLNVVNSDSFLGGVALSAFFHLANEKQKCQARNLIGKISNSLSILIISNLYPAQLNLKDIVSFLKDGSFLGENFRKEISSLLELVSYSDLDNLVKLFYKETKDMEDNNQEAILDELLIYCWSHLDGENRDGWIEVAIDRFRRLGTLLVHGSQNGLGEGFDFSRRMMLLRAVWNDNPGVDMSNIVNSKPALVQTDDLDNLISFSLSLKKDDNFREWLCGLVAHLKYINDISAQKEKLPWFARDRANKEELLQSLNALKENVVKNWSIFVVKLYAGEFLSMSFAGEGSLSKTRGWKILVDSDRHIALGAAKEFLSSFSIAEYSLDCLGNRLSSVFEAMQLIWELDSQYIKCWTSDMWKKMFGYVVHSSMSSYLNGDDYFRLAYIHDPDEVATMLIERLSKRRSIGSKSWDRLIAEERMRHCGDRFLVDRIIESLKSSDICLNSRGDLCKILLEIGVDKGCRYVADLVRQRYSSMTAWKRGIEAVCALMESDASGGRDLVSHLLCSKHPRDKRFVCQVIRRYSVGMRGYRFLKTWNMDCVVDLYVFLHDNQETIDKRRWGKVWYWRTGCAADVCNWKRAMLHHLAANDDVAKLAYLFKLTKLVTECSLLQSYWELVRMIYFREVWSPPNPEMIFTMVDDRKARPICNGQQLLEVMKDCLSCFEKDMNISENPLVETLWNVINDVRTPKNEAMLSNVLKKHLSHDLGEMGCIFNREVVVFDDQGGMPGERIDIKVDVSYDVDRCISLQAVIEVKGCWNNDLETGMEEQMVKRYMMNRRYGYGLYVIGWFKCPQWSLKSDSRRPPRYSLMEAREKYAEQALLLSSKYNVQVESIVLDLSLK